MKINTFNTRVSHIVTRAALPRVHCWEDIPDKRIKIQFPLDPGPETKNLLIHNGFRFRAGSTQAWCRRLDTNGRTAARFVMAQLMTMPDTNLPP